MWHIQYIFFEIWLNINELKYKIYNHWFSEIFPKYFTTVSREVNMPWHLSSYEFLFKIYNERRPINS